MRPQAALTWAGTLFLHPRGIRNAIRLVVQLAAHVGLDYDCDINYVRSPGSVLPGAKYTQHPKEEQKGQNVKMCLD